VLYVEDNPANLELVEQIIHRYPNLRMLSAADGGTGIEFARTYLPQVILMDINLPGISGIEAMKVLRVDPLTAHIPVIALSANAVPRDIQKGLQAGFFAYITKPIRVPELMKTLELALIQSHAAAPPPFITGNYVTLTATDILSARILVVDDQQVNVSLLEEMLVSAGYTQVSTTLDPKVVCRMHRDTPFDLILLDLQLPGMDGFQVMEGLKANSTDSYLPVLVITAQPGHKLRALHAGAKDFVSKPFDMVEVKARIHNLIEIRLLHRQLQRQNQELERQVQSRTAELQESEARYRALTELATDWYWEQDQAGNFTKVSGPVLEMLGMRVAGLEGTAQTLLSEGWHEEGRKALQERIESRMPFIDFPLERTLADGSRQTFRVSGTPMFNSRCDLIGYRGVGVEIRP
jgi:PAS domain S-box-containing protein